MGKGRRHRALIGFVAAALVLSAAAAIRFVRGPEVAIVHPVRRDIVQTVVSSGRVMAPAEVTLSAFTSSTVAEILAREGETVNAGQLLARLDDRELLSAVHRAQAAVAHASAGAVEVRRLSLPAARERLRQAQTTLAQAERTLERDDALIRRGSISQVAIEQSRTALEVARSQKDAAALQAEAASSTGTSSLAAAATLAQAKAELASAEVSLERSRIVSPLDGVVLERLVEPGDSVQPGARLFVISGVGRTRIVIEPDERNLALLRLGQPALASAEAFPSERFAAKVSYIAPSVDARRGTIEVRLDVETPPSYLRPDMTISVEIEVARKASALVVPLGAVHDVSSPHPWVLVLSDGRVERRDIGLGLLGDGVIEVTTPLPEGSAIAAVASASLVPGSRARPKASSP